MVLPVAIILIILLFSDYFYYHFHYFKTGSSDLGEYNLIAEQRQVGSSPYTTSGIISARSKCPVQALAQAHQRHHPDMLA